MCFAPAVGLRDGLIYVTRAASSLSYRYEAAPTQTGVQRWTFKGKIKETVHLYLMTSGIKSAA